MPRPISTSVREFVSLALQTGDLVPRTSQRISGVEGTRAHQRVQKSRPEDYTAECSVTETLEHEEFELTFRGRIDGLYDRSPLILEEIKSTRRPLEQLEPRSAHLAQVEVYAALLMRQRPELKEVMLHLTYVELPNMLTRTFDFLRTRAEVEACFAVLLACYTPALRRRLDWAEVRAASLRLADFPFADFRRGQLALMREVFREARVMAEAPTGIGKTLSVLYPAVKLLGQGRLDRIWYLTAKNSGKQMAADALTALGQHGARLKSLTITAKDRMSCVPDLRCDPAVCENAIGYYERLDGGIADMFQYDAWTPARVREVAARNRLCPFDFSLDLAPWADVLLCDYNYAFDPRVWLRFLLEERKERNMFLADEAHNLVDRGRDMFSSQLGKQQVADVHRAVKKDAPELGRALARLSRAFTSLAKLEPVLAEPPEALVNAVRGVVQAGDVWMGSAAEDEPPWRALFLDFYFACSQFGQAADRFNSDYRFLQEDARDELRARIFCVDPSNELRTGLQRARRSVLFSATLQPADYYLELLGAKAGQGLFQLGSPFPEENLQVFAAKGISTVYRMREQSYQPIADLITRFRSFQSGNLLVFFPSYAYLDEVAKRLDVPHIRQVGGMDEGEQQGFLDDFVEGGNALGLVVLGGSFAEGIDLVGERLSGAILVGVGLPQVGLERDLIRAHFADKGRDGFHYAFTYPGWTRVLQAAGRVIRSAEDRGSILLIGQRFGRPPYPELFPVHWPKVVWSGD